MLQCKCLQFVNMPVKVQLSQMACQMLAKHCCYQCISVCISVKQSTSYLDYWLLYCALYSSFLMQISFVVTALYSEERKSLELDCVYCCDFPSVSVFCSYLTHARPCKWCTIWNSVGHPEILGEITWEFWCSCAILTICNIARMHLQMLLNLGVLWKNILRTQYYILEIIYKTIFAEVLFSLRNFFCNKRCMEAN